MDFSANLNQPADYYKHLFNQMEQGYALIEVLFNADDIPVDILYIEANAAANRMSGTQLAGKRITELDPDYEQQWFEIFGRIAKTGISESHEMYAPPFAGFYRFHGFKVGHLAERKVAVFYEDITQYKQLESSFFKSDEKYRTLFESIDEAFVVIELLFDDHGKVKDFIYREENPNHAVNSGLNKVTGKKASEIFPNLEPQWLAVFQEVYTTGKAARGEDYNADTGRWYRYYHSRVGGPGNPFIATVSTNITERKRREQHQAFILNLSDQLRKELTPDAVANRALQLLIDYLKLDRSYITTYYLDENRADLDYQIGNETVPPLPGHFVLTDYPEAFKSVFDKTFIIEDEYERQGLSEKERQNSGKLGMRAMLAATLRKGDNHPLWSMVAISSQPRRWAQNGVSLVEEVAERTWAAVERAKAEVTSRQSEEKYRSLFDNIDEGFALMELHRDNDGKVIDLTYREVNNAFKQFTGWHNAVGKRGTELMPNLEPHLLDIMRSVADTGQPYRQEDHVADLDKWYDVHYSCVGQPGTNFIVAVFKDTTERKHNEERQKFLLNLSDNLGVADSLKDIQTTVINALHEHYDAGWCYYVEWDEEKKAGVVQYDSKRGELLSLAGTHDVSDVPEFLDLLKSGQILNVSDYEDYELLTPVIRKRYTAAGFRSMLVASLVRQGRLISSLIIGDTKIRNWLHYDETLFAEVAERTWAAVERAKAEEALRESEKRFQSIVNLVPDLLWESEPDGLTNWYNQRWLEYTGQRFEQAIGWGWIDAIHPDDREGSAKRYAKAIATGKPLRQDHRIRRTDGEYRWFVVDALPLIDENGRVIKMYGTATDIHDRRQAEEALGKSEAKYRELFERIEEGFCIIEMLFDGNKPVDYRFIEVNPAFEHQTGIVNAKGRLMREIAPDHEQHWFDYYGQVALTGKTQHFDAFAKALGNRWYDVHSFRVGQPEQHRVAIVFNDITERRKTAAALQDFNRKLEQEVQDRTAELHQNRDLLQATLDSNLDMIQVFKAVRNEAGKIIDFTWILNNHASEQVYGDVIGKSLLQNNPGVRTAGIFDEFVKVTETGIPQQYERHYVYEQFNGWFYQSVVKLNDGVATNTANITSRKMAENERFNNYLLLQQTEDVALLGSWEYDLSSCVFTWSDGMYRLFDLEKGTEIKPEIYLEYATNASKAAAQRVVDHIRTGNTDFEETLEISVANQVKVLHLKAAVVKNADGHATRVLGVDMDVTAMRTAEEKIRKMEAEQQLEIFRVSLRTLEEERHRISESLHNGIGQILYGVKLSLNNLNQKDSNNDFNEIKNYTNTLLTDAIIETRRISHELMPTTLQDFGLKSAIDDICKQLSDGVKFNCQVNGLHSRLEKYLELAVYRTVQELMTNVVKHAKATQAIVRIDRKVANIKIIVSDNGQGMETTIKKSRGIGLSSIRSKIKLLNGEVTVNTGRENGTTVEVIIPIPEKSI